MATSEKKRILQKQYLGNFFDPHGISGQSIASYPIEYQVKDIPSRRSPHRPLRYGDNVIADLDASGVLVRSYVTPMLDQNISMTVLDDSTLAASGLQLPATFYYNQDERQSVMNLTDDTGVVAQDYGYSAYGDKLRSQVSSLIPNRYTFTGRELSDTTGNFYFRYRTYSAGTGSFISRDPLGFVDGMSVYIGWFARKMMMDPFGKAACEIVIYYGHGKKIDKNKQASWHNVDIKSDYGKFAASFTDADKIGGCSAVGVYGCWFHYTKKRLDLVRRVGKKMPIWWVNSGNSYTYRSVKRPWPKFNVVGGESKQEVTAREPKGYVPKTGLQINASLLANAKLIAPKICAKKACCCKTVSLKKANAGLPEGNVIETYDCINETWSVLK